MRSIMFDIILSRYLNNRKIHAYLAIACTHIVQAAIAAPAMSEEISGQHTARESNPVRLYRTREEQREAGLKRQITPWLTVSGLVEGEALFEEFDIQAGNATDSSRSESAGVQFGFVATPSEWVNAEVIFEFDTEDNQVAIDEAFISLEIDEWELSLGKQYTPFGVYFSSFASNAILEFGETQSDQAISLAYEPIEDTEIVFSLYRGLARNQEQNAGEWNWAIGGEFWPHQDWSFGLSYQSDLADSDGRLLDDYNGRYGKQVAGISAYLLWVGHMLEVSVETVAATSSFKELDADRNKPLAWNTEVAYFLPGSNVEIAFRFEGSQEIEDAPRYQYGAAVTWRTGKFAALTIEYLHGEFEGALATTENDDPYNHVNRVGAIMSMEF